MPTPIGHSLAAIAIARTGKSDRSTKLSTLALYAGACFLACLPDIDLAIGYLIGDPRRFHHGPAHSITFAFAIALATSLLLPRIDGQRLRVFLLAFACVASHGLLDMLRASYTPRSGVQYLWPFSQKF
jgi:inner membrane protein